jgi:hypothetical protein
MEGRGCAAVGQEAAFDFEEAVGGFRVIVVGGISAGLYFLVFPRWWCGEGVGCALDICV